MVNASKEPTTPAAEPKKTRTFVLTVFPYASQPPMIKEIFDVGGIPKEWGGLMPGPRQFLINMPPAGAGETTIKEIY